jgi:membrane protease YdiL (CAAX protease family)
MHQTGGPVEFSAIYETTRIVMYTIPSLILVWYLMLKQKSLREWGVTLPRKKDMYSAALTFPALVLVGLTFSFVSPYFDDIPAGPKFLPPGSAAAWVVLIVSCTISAYLEESYFRFYLLSKREEMGLGPHRAVLVSTLLFALCHVYEGPWGFLNSTLSGVILAVVFLRFRSLHGIAAAHAMYNILVYALGTI